ncbi:MAG: biotin synthase BioB [Candidatus Brocadiales bacterium]
MDTHVRALGEKVLSGSGVTRDEALFICGLEGDTVYELLYWANKIRQRFLGSYISCCALVSAKQGRCPEDCGFCAQSARFNTAIREFPLMEREGLRKAVEGASGLGAGSLGIVTSGRELSGGDLDKLCERIRAINGTDGVHIHASLGLLTPQGARQLKDCGVRRINHNLETSEKNFPRLCTTHSYNDRMRTIRTAKETGLEVCSGGIFGVGESPDDRVDLAFTLKELDVDTTPLNFLHPIPGTPLANVKPLSPMEILKIIALFRFVLPEKEIKVAGGREKNLADLQSWIFYAGANSIIIGGYLSTRGRAPEEDFRMISDLGLKIKR